MGAIVADISHAQDAALHAYQGDIQELTSVFVSHLPSFHRIALRRLGNAADAEDAVQDAFVSAYTHLNQFRGEAQMSTWLTTIVINSARAKVRRRPRPLHIPLDQKNQARDAGTFSETLPDHRPNPEQVCRTWELAELLAGLSVRLTPTLRTAFQLFNQEGLSIREAAEVLGAPNGAVKARVARARLKLKQLAHESLRQTIPRRSGVRPPATNASERARRNLRRSPDTTKTVEMTPRQSFC